MNYLQLLQRVQLECDVAGNPPTDVTSSVIGATGDLARLATWINAAWNDIQTAHNDWGWMRQTMTVDTVGISTPLYTLAACGITGNFTQWQRETFRNYVNPAVNISIASPCVVTLNNHGLNVGDEVEFYTTGALPTGLSTGAYYFVWSIVDANNFTLSATSGGAAINTTGSQSGIQTITSNNTTSFVGFLTEIFMEYMDYDIWRNGYLFGALRTSGSRPLVVTIDPQMSLGFGPIASAGYTVVGDYFVGPTALVVATDTPNLPIQYHEAIVYKAMMHYGAFMGAPEVLNRGEAEFAKMMARLDSTRLPDVLINGTLA